jgi:hypothetical protein
MNWRFKILNFLFRLYILMILLIIKKIKQIYTLVLLPPFLTHWVFVFIYTLDHHNFVTALDSVIPTQLFV